MKICEIGRIYTPFKKIKGILILLYYFHQIKKKKLQVFPYMDENLHGIFATRAPVRPNPIGISITRLISIDENILFIKGIDVLNNTPLLDIKPYVPKFDDVSFRNEEIKIGWLKDKIYKLNSTKDDSRFE